jgi:lipoprotein-releasing system ATP-binding protein
VGSSGAGKSTLLHILGTLDQPDRGAVYLNELQITSLRSKKLSQFRNKHIGFIFQFHHLLPEFSALENVCIPGWISNAKKSLVKERAKELLTILGLKDREEHKPSQLSGGEQQRVAVARALINTPSVVFADEPTGNLDSANAKELHHLFFELRKKFNQTFLIVTHNEELAQLSDRIVHMKDGKINNI